MSLNREELDFLDWEYEMARHFYLMDYEGFMEVTKFLRGDEAT